MALGFFRFEFAHTPFRTTYTLPLLRFGVRLFDRWPCAIISSFAFSLGGKNDSILIDLDTIYGDLRFGA